MELTNYQRDIIIRTILGEARGEGDVGMAAVAHNILNRANSGRFPSDPAKVALQPKQYSVWNEGAGGGKTNFAKDSDLYKRAGALVDGVFGGTIPDMTGGALYYHTPSVKPHWASAVNKHGTSQIGNHIFYHGRPVPPGEIPNIVGTALDVIPGDNVPLSIRDGAWPLAYTDPRTGELYQGVEAPEPAMRQGLLDQLKQGPRQQVMLPELPPSTLSAAPVVPPAMDPVGVSPAWGGLASAFATPSSPATNSVPAADLLVSTRNDYSPFIKKDISGITDIADIIHSKDMVTSLEQGQAPPAAAGLLSLLAGDQTPRVDSIGTMPPRSDLAALLGVSAQPGAVGPALNLQQVTTGLAPKNAPGTHGGFAGQEATRGLASVPAPADTTMAPTNTPGIFRLNDGVGFAGSVAMPRDARPDVTIPEHVGTPGIGRVDSVNAMPTFDAFQEAFGAPVSFPNPTRSVAEMEKTQRKPGLSQPLSPNQNGGLVAQDKSPQFKTVMREERVENPEFKVWQANQTAKVDTIPLGDAPKYGSRDSVAQRQAGENFVATQMPERWITRQVPTRVSVPAPAPAAIVRPSVAVAPAAQPRGLFDMLMPSASPLASLLGIQQRAPTQIDQGQVAQMAAAGLLNPASARALSQGRTTYSPDGGGLIPTVAMNGNIRYTYGDGGGGSLVG